MIIINFIILEINVFKFSYLYYLNYGFTNSNIVLLRYDLGVLLMQSFYFNVHERFK